MMLRKKLTALVLCVMMVSGLLLTGCADHGETKAYTFHDVYVGAQSLIESHKNSNRCEDIYLNEDGSMTLVLTERQRKKWADSSDIEAMLIPMKMMGLSVEYSEDYTQLTISAPDGVAEAASPMILNFAWVAELHQILGGVEDWSLEVTVINSDTGEIVQHVNLPEEELDWSFVQQ